MSLNSNYYSVSRLDPELARAVGQMPPIDNRDVEKARQGIAMMQKFMPPVDSSGLDISDLQIPSRQEGADHHIPIRIYKPVSADSPLPVMLYFHWGGFMLGDLETEHARCVMISKFAEIVVVSVDYRLAPEHPFPAGVEDCYAALLWTVEHAPELNIDPQRAAVGGTSAGGGLAAALSLMSRDRKGPAISFQFLGFPVTDDQMQTESVRHFTDTPNWTHEATINMWAYYLGDPKPAEVSPYAAPLRADDLTNLPPAYIWTGEFDPLRDEGIQYALRLMSANVPVELHNFAGTFHGFDQTPEAAIAQRSQREQVAVIRAAFGERRAADLGGKGATLSHTMIHVADVVQTADWYRRVFDLEIKFLAEDKQYAELMTGGTTLAFSSEGLEEQKYGRFVANRKSDLPAGFHLAIQVSNLAECYQSALEEGAVQINPPEPQPWGPSVARIRDLNGILVAIGERQN